VAVPSTSFDSSRPSHQTDDGSRSQSAETGRWLHAETVPLQRTRSVDGGTSRNRLSTYAPSDYSGSHTPPTTAGGKPSSRLRIKLRQHSSETHLSALHKRMDSDPPPVPSRKCPSSPNMANVLVPNPTIITTAPTLETEAISSNSENPQPTLVRKRSKLFQFTRSKNQEQPEADETPAEVVAESPKKQDVPKKRFNFPSLRASRDPGLELRKLAGERMEAKKSSEIPPSATSLDLDHSEAVSPSITAEENSPSDSTRSFNWLAKKKSNRKSLFPIVADKPKAHTAPPTVAPSPRPSTSGIAEDSSREDDSPRVESKRALQSAGNPNGATSPDKPTRASLHRSGSMTSNQTSESSPALALPTSGHRRTRSSTAGSVSGFSEESPPTPPFAHPASGRTSTSTAGRSSFSNLFHMNRFRNNDPMMSPRQGSGTNITTSSTLIASGSNSMSISRDSISLPPRDEGETAKQYLERVEEMAHRSQIPSNLAQKTDAFFYAVMRSFMRKFAFFGDPLDMAIRKLLLEVDLPKETQQIDRVLQGFAERYEECNPGIFDNADNAYLMSFSLLLLHSDFHNKNNKRKMSKADYLKNLRGQGTADEILDCFYDNVIYTPFIRVEDEQDIMAVRSRRTNRKTARAAKAAKLAIKNGPSDGTRKNTSKEPLDPYTLIFESRLDTLRPPIAEYMNLKDPYTYLGSIPVFDSRVLKNSKVGVVQIESARSRPDAFMSQPGIDNPEANARVGLVDLPVGKIGVLWRKDPKKKTARSPWQEWGAMLTGTSLYFFKNANWIKQYMNQYEAHLKHGGQGSLCFFKPSLKNFTPDYMLPTDHGVALTDSTYKRHKYAFTFFRHNGSEEVFLADNELEMNDWLAKINHQAACRTAGIPQRGLVGGQYDGQLRRGMRRLESNDEGDTSVITSPNSTPSVARPTLQQAVRTIQTSTGEVTIRSGHLDLKLAQQISLARAQVVEGKIAEAEEKLTVAEEQLDEELRNARHLLILAPIQQRTREGVIQAADKYSEKMKKLRVDIWRLKCHRDILQMDLDEEKREYTRRQQKMDGVLSPSPNDSTRAIEETGSKQHTPKVSQATAAEEGSETDAAEQAAQESAVDDAQQDGSDRAATPTRSHKDRRRSSGQRSQSDAGVGLGIESPARSPMSQKTGAVERGRGHSHGYSISTLSNNSITSRQQPNAPRSSWDGGAFSSPEPSPMVANFTRERSSSRSRSRSATRPAENQEHGKRPETPKSVNGVGAEGSDKFEKVTSTPERAFSNGSGATQPSSGGKLRNPFTRPIRDSSLKNQRRISQSASSSPSSISKPFADPEKTPTADQTEFPGSINPQSPTSHPSSSSPTGKGKDPSGLSGDETLPPHIGLSHLQRDGSSFTVHGKKASIVTFGGDWAERPEERLAALQQVGRNIRAGASPLANGMRARSVSGGSTNLSGSMRRKVLGDNGSVRTQGSGGTVTGPTSAPMNGGLREDDYVGARDMDGELSGSPTPNASVLATPAPGSPSGSRRHGRGADDDDEE
jgi:hypothetical protein